MDVYVYTCRFTHAKVESLSPGKEYQFRVIAENLNGRGDPCEPTGTIKTEDSAGRKGMEGQLTVTPGPPFTKTVLVYNII